MVPEWLGDEERHSVPPKAYLRDRDFRQDRFARSGGGPPAAIASKTGKEERKMPEFAHPFSGMNSDRKLTTEEMARAIRYSISAEYEAIQLYMQLAESTDNELAREVLIDVANEEKVHAGEFLRLLKELAPDEEKFYQDGYEEVGEIMKKMGK